MGMVFLSQAARSVLLAAILADSVDLEGVAGSCVMVSIANLLFQTVNLGREKFHGTPAPGTDHVMVAAAVVLMLVPGDTIVKGDFAGQAALGQQLQRPVNRGETDAGVFLLHQPVQFVDGEVLASLKKSSQNGVALRRLFQAHTFKMPMQKLLRFADHLGRNTGLIVNAFLQHRSSGNFGSGLLNNTGLWETSQPFRGVLKSSAPTSVA
jgi:hypothetical protein